MFSSHDISSQWEDFLQSGDARSNAQPFVRAPTMVVTAVVGYLAMVMVGPRIMRDRQPWNVKKVLI